MTTTSLEFSKRLHKLLGEFETELSWCQKRKFEEPFATWFFSCSDLPCDWCKKKSGFTSHIPAPSFSELIRLLLKLGEKLELDVNRWGKTYGVLAGALTDRFRNAPTESEGMAAVESYLESLLPKE